MSIRDRLGMFLVLSVTLGGAVWSHAQPTVADDQRVDRIRRALERLPYYGVFDFLAFTYERGTVTLSGFAYRASLPGEARSAARNVSGVDEVVNRIEVLPVGQNDDRIRWATFYTIYTDEFLSRYAPGGGLALRAERRFASPLFPGSQPLGHYPIHIIVRRGRTTLLGVVDNEADKNVAGLRAREVSGVFEVKNELMVSGGR